MKKLSSAGLFLIAVIACSAHAYADIPSVPRPIVRSSNWIVILIVAVVLIAAAFLIRALRRRK